MKSHQSHLANSMLKCWILGLVLLFLTNIAKAQCPETNPRCHDADHWIFGDSIYMHFVDTGIVVSKKPMYSYEASSALVDKKGDLILYGNSEQFYDSSDKVFFESDYGDISSAQGMHFERIRDDSVAHFFIQDSRWNSRHYFFYGKIRLKDFSIYDTSILFRQGTEQIARVNHQNQRDVWIATHENFSKRVLVFLIQPTGVLCCPVIRDGESAYKESFHAASQMKFSPDGRFLVISPGVSTEFFDFNSQTGVPSFRGILNSSYSVEFSSNIKNIFYSISSVDAAPIDSFTYDRWVSPWLWAVSDSYNVARGGLQLGPDGRIYVAMRDKNKVEYVEDPDAFFQDIKYSTTGIQFPSSDSCSRSLPAFNASAFYTPASDFAYEHECGTLNYTFTARDTFGAPNHYWLITNDSTGKTYNFFGKRIKMVFPEPSTYKQTYHVRYIAYSSKKADTSIKVLNLYKPLRPNFLGPDTFYCKGQSVTLRVPDSMHCVHWNGKEPNYDPKIGPTVDYDNFHVDSLSVDTIGSFYVRATNKAFCQQNDTIRVSEKPIPQKPIINETNGTLTANIKSHRYRWFVNDTFIAEKENQTLIPTRNNYYQVQLVSEFGCISERSDSFLVDFVSIDNNPITSRFSVYPNPSNGHILVSFNKTGNYHIQVYTLDGKLILQTSVEQKQSASFEILKSGKYLVNYTSTDGDTGSQTIIVQ